MVVLLLPPAVGALQPPLPLVLGDPALTCLCVRVAFMNIENTQCGCLCKFSV